MWRTVNGSLKVSTASRPPKPLALVEIGKLWKAEKFSTLIHEGQEVVNPQAALAARSRFAAAPTSGQYLAAISGPSPAPPTLTLLYLNNRVRALNGNCCHVK